MSYADIKNFPLIVLYEIFHTPRNLIANIESRWLHYTTHRHINRTLVMDDTFRIIRIQQVRKIIISSIYVLAQ